MYYTLLTIFNILRSAHSRVIKLMLTERISYYMILNCSLMLLSSALCTKPECVKANLRFLDFFVKMWLLKACFLLIFPEPVTVKRFLALDLVFILGICS